MLMGISRFKLSKKKQEELLRYFIGEVTARTAAELSGLNRRTVILYYHKIRQIIAERWALEEEEMFGGEIELDEIFWRRPQRKTWSRRC